MRKTRSLAGAYLPATANGSLELGKGRRGAFGRPFLWSFPLPPTRLPAYFRLALT
jgi:hypothetical protein